MIWRRWLVVLGAIVIAAWLAYQLRGVVNQLIIVPLAYLLWLLNLLYLSLDQGIWWIIVLLVVLIILGQSLLPELQWAKKLIPFTRPARGNVESLARAIQKSDEGIYFKWLVANRLGRLAYQILLQHEHGKPRSVFAPLVGETWDAPVGVQRYLEKGLHGSFADFPNSHRNYFAPPQKTPLDHDVGDVVGFLESKLENPNLPERPKDAEIP